MKVIFVSLAQLLELQQAHKTFLLLIIGDWIEKSLQSVITTLENGLQNGSYVLFVLRVCISSEAEEYSIHTFKVRSLPSVAYFRHGSMNVLQEVDSRPDLSNLRDAALALDELLMFHPSSSLKLYSLGNFNKVGQLFLSGDRSSVGKSSMCLAMLVALLKRGADPSTLAYIKPITQCEAEQPVTQFCNRVGIANRGIGPVVFYKGFTRSFLNGEAGTADALLSEAKQAVDDIGHGKSFVLVDGVGYPSVGSICNLSNADMAHKLRAPVLLVGKSGVGDAVDSYNLNSTFFEHKGVHVLGGVFNKLPMDGYYSLEACKEAVTQYFTLFKPKQRPYGFMPVIAATPTTAKITNASENDTETDTASGAVDAVMDTGTAMDVSTTEQVPVRRYEFTAFEEEISEAFLRHVDVDRLLHDVWMHELTRDMVEITGTSSAAPLPSLRQSDLIAPGHGRLHEPTPPATAGAANRSPTSMRSSASTTHSAPVVPVEAAPVQSSTVGTKRSRQEIEDEARSQGAKGG